MLDARISVASSLHPRASFAAETRTRYKRNRGSDIPLSLQPFHNPRQFGAQPRSLNVVIVRNGILKQRV